MAGRTRTIVFPVLMSLVSVWGGSARAGIDLPPWSARLASGFDNPIFWVLFNPQPEPPGHEMILDTSVPTAPVFTVRSNSEGKFTLVFAVENISDLFSGFQCVTGTRGFQVLAMSSVGPLNTASFSFESGGSGGSDGAGASFLAPGSDVMFNPQPEPPGYPGVVVSFSLLDPATGAPPPAGSEVGMTLQVAGPGGELMSLSPVSVPFVRGDANADGTPDMSDAVKILGFLFLGTTMNDCQDAADVNDDGEVDISDPVWLLGYLFLGSKRPPDPFAACGVDLTGDELDCKTFNMCP